MVTGESRLSLQFWLTTIDTWVSFICEPEFDSDTISDEEN